MEIKMSFFGKLFGNKKSSQPESTQKVHLSKNSGVPYNKELIKTLLKDHNQLIEMFAKISKLAKKKKYKTLKQTLKTFKIEMEVHNYSEKIQLYVYLKNYYKNSDNEDFIKEMASSSEEIYKDVAVFLKKYEDIEFNDQYLALFNTELEAVGRILQSRIAIEESELYPLYKK